MMTLRPVRLPEDASALCQLDTAFTTKRVYRVQATGLSFALELETITPPITKSFDLSSEVGEDRLWKFGVVAETHDTLVGFAAARHERWNNRTALWHLYVTPNHRGIGLGKLLLAQVENYARQQNSRGLWLETSNVNYAAIQFYRHQGFVWCGLDESLYAPESEGAGETALYFFKNLS